MTICFLLSCAIAWRFILDIGLKTILYYYIYKNVMFAQTFLSLNPPIFSLTQKKTSFNLGISVLPLNTF